MDAASLPSDLEAQVYETVLDPSGAGAESVDALCASHPEFESAIRALVQKLVQADQLIPPPRASAAESKAPDKLGEYELVREAGRGGMGVVYEAWQPTLRRSVALKILPGQFGLSESAVERFRREGAAGARLRHEGIIDIFGFGEDSGHYFLAMEFVEGAPLHKVMADLNAREGALAATTIAEIVETHAHRITHEGAQSTTGARAHWPADPIRFAVQIAAQVAGALAHAHRAGIVHRDVKPSNILVRPDGRVVLTDFGLAQDAELPSLTISGQFTGTPHYASPEQAAGSRSIDTRSDVFSLGAMLYEMVTRTAPFAGGSSQEVLARIQREEPRDPQRLCPEVSDDLAAVILHAMEKDPGRRYPTADAFAADLEAILAYRSVSARRASSWDRARRWIQREPLRATIGALLIVGVPTIGVLAGISIANAPKVAAAEAMEKRVKIESILTEAQIRLGSRDYKRAQALFQDVLDLDAALPEACAGLGYAQLADGNAAGAKAFLAQLAPELREHPAVARVILWTEGARDSDDVDARAKAAEAARDPFELMLLAEEEARRGDATADHAATPRARMLFRAALRASARARPWIHSRLAQLAGAAGDVESVRQLTRAMERLWPGQILTYEGVAIAYVHIDPDRAIETANAGLRLRETAQLYLARSHAHLERTKDRRVRRDDELWDAAVAGALADCHAALALDPERVSTLGHLARIHYAAGNFNAALAAADQALAKEPNHQLYLWQRAHSLSRLGRYKESAAAWDRALELFPNWEQAWNNFANVALKAGNVDQALRAARTAVKIEPDYVIGLCTLGEAQIANRSWAAARATFEKCVKLAPGDSYSHEQLAELLIREDIGKVRDPNRALVAARRVSEIMQKRLGGRGISAEILLGRVLLACGDKAAAVTTLERVRQAILKNTNPRVKARLQSVEALLRRAAQ